MSNDTVTKKKSAFLNNLKMQKLKSEMKPFKVDQLVKTADDHYIIFSGKTIFKSVNSGSEALLDIEKLKNGEITLGLTNLFEQKTINDVKDDVSNIEILDFYKDDYSSITRANDKEGNELIVGIRPGSMDDLTHSIINEGRKYIKTLNHIYHEDDVLNLLNTEIDNITPGELKLLTDFLNNNNPNIKDFSVNDDNSKPDIMAYKSIELVEESEASNKIFKEYCVDDTHGQSQYIMYLIDKYTKNIIDWFADTEKHAFIKIDDQNRVGIIRDNQFKTNTLGTFDCKIYDLNNTHFIDSTYSIETLNTIKDTVYRAISFNYKLEELSFNYNLLFAIPNHENNNSNDWYTPVFNPEQNYKYELYKINDEYDCICATNRHSSGGSALYTKNNSPDYKIGSMMFNTLTGSSSGTYYQLIHNIDWSVEVISELWKHPNSGEDIKYCYIENDSFKKCYNYFDDTNHIIFLPNKYDFTYIDKALVTDLNTGYEYYARLTNVKTYSKIGTNEEKFAYIKEEIMGTSINSNSVSLTEYKIYAKTTSNDIKCVYYKTNAEFEIYTISVGSIKYMFTFGAKTYDNSSLPSSCKIIKSSTLIESRSVTLEEKIVNNKLHSYYVFDSDTVTKYYFTVFNNAVTKYSTFGYKFVTRTDTKYLAVHRDIFNNETYNVGDRLIFTTYDVSSNTYDDMVYKSIELEFYHNYKDQNFKEYKITDKNDNVYHIIYWYMTENPELIKEIYSGTEKMRFISHSGYNSVDTSTVTIIIPNSTGKNSKNVSGYLFNFYDSKIYNCIFSNVGALCLGKLTQYKFNYTINSSAIERYIIMDDFTTDMTLDFSSIGDVRKSWFNTTNVEPSVTNYFIYSTNSEFKVNGTVNGLLYNSSTKQITGYDGNTYLSIKFCADTGFTSTKYPFIAELCVQSFNYCTYYGYVKHEYTDDPSKVSSIKATNKDSTYFASTLYHEKIDEKTLFISDGTNCIIFYDTDSSWIDVTLPTSYQFDLSSAYSVSAKEFKLTNINIDPIYVIYDVASKKIIMKSEYNLLYHKPSLNDMDSNKNYVFVFSKESIDNYSTNKYLIYYGQTSYVQKNLTRSPNNGYIVNISGLGIGSSVSNIYYDFSRSSWKYTVSYCSTNDVYIYDFEIYFDTYSSYDKTLGSNRYLRYRNVIGTEARLYYLHGTNYESFKLTSVTKIDVLNFNVDGYYQYYKFTSVSNSSKVLHLIIGEYQGTKYIIDSSLTTSTISVGELRILTSPNRTEFIGMFRGDFVAGPTICGYGLKNGSDYKIEIVFSQVPVDTTNWAYFDTSGAGIATYMDVDNNTVCMLTH